MPRYPYTKIQLPTALTMFAVMSATVMGRTTFIACRYRRNTW